MSTARGRGEGLPATEPAAYAPVSGLAVAALLISGITAFAIVALLVGARLAGKPSTATLLLVPAAVGFGLATAARWQIRRGEGTRSGLGLANVAWWLAILSGGSYA